MANFLWKLQEYVAHGSDVKCLALGQSSGRLMVTGGEDTKVNVWSLDKPNCLLSLSGHTSPVEAVRLNRKELVVAGGSSTGVVKIWDLEASKVTHSFSNHKGAVQSIEFHTSGPFVATGSADHSIKLWDLRRKGCINTYKGHPSGVTCVRFSPDGRWLASSDDTGVVKLWKLEAGKELHEFKDHSTAIASIAFNPKDMVLASGSSDGIVKFWDLDKLELIGSSKEDNPPVRAMLFHPEGMCLYNMASKALSAYRWDPVQRCCSLPVDYSNATDMIITQNQLIAADFSQNKVSTFVVDIKKIPPIDNDSLSPHGSGRRTFRADDKSVDPAAKPVKSPPGAENGDDVSGGGGVEVKDPEFDKIIRRGNQIRPFEAPSEEGFIAADRNKPAGLNPYDFMMKQDPMSGDKNPRSEAEALQFLLQGHSNVMSIVSNRHRNLRVVKSEWMSAGVKSAMVVAIGQRDLGAIVDLLHILLGKLSLWNLDLCQSLLPVLTDLLNSKYENYMHISLSTLRLIVQTFGSIIRNNISSPPSAGQIDLARQDRYYKCLSCHKELKRILDRLDQLLATRYNQGRLGDKFKEIRMLITQML